MPDPGRSLIAELDNAIRTGSEGDRVETLRKLTNLFLASSARLSDEQIEVFDEIILHLIKRVESRFLAELSKRLAPIEKAPNRVIQSLARNEEIAIAGPVLAFSLRLTSADLIEIARSKGPAHLCAILRRDDLGPSVTDVLLNYGNEEVRQKLASNHAARFSDEGMTQLIHYAESDHVLSGKLGVRMDVPLHLIRRLLEITPDHVRRELLAAAPPSHRADILDILQTMGQTPDDVALDVDQTRSRLTTMYEEGELDETVLLQFARNQRKLELSIALAVLCSVEHSAMEQICESNKAENLLMPCRAAGVSWNGFRAIIAVSPVTAGLGEQRIAEIKRDYMRLSISAAQRVLRIRCAQIGQVRQISTDVKVRSLGMQFKDST